MKISLPIKRSYIVLLQKITCIQDVAEKEQQNHRNSQQIQQIRSEMHSIDAFGAQTFIANTGERVYSWRRLARGVQQMPC